MEGKVLKIIGILIGAYCVFAFLRRLLWHLRWQFWILKWDLWNLAGNIGFFIVIGIIIYLIYEWLHS